MKTIQWRANSLALVSEPLGKDELTFHVLNGLGPNYKESSITFRAHDTFMPSYMTNSQSMKSSSISIGYPLIPLLSWPILLIMERNPISHQHNPSLRTTSHVVTIHIKVHLNLGLMLSVNFVKNTRSYQLFMSQNSNCCTMAIHSFHNLEISTTFLFSIFFWCSFLTSTSLSSSCNSILQSIG